MNKKYTTKQKMELTEQVNALINQGVTRKKAIHNVGISDAIYWRWDRLAKRKSQTKTRAILPLGNTRTEYFPPAKKHKLALFVGSVDDVLECFRRLS